jgi:hypothetical protein
MGFNVQVTFDSANPDGLARFWAGALGYKIQDPPEGFDSWPAFLEAMNVPKDQWDRASAIVDPTGRGPRFFFQKVPEPKTAKNRMHIDLTNPAGRSLTPEERRAVVTAKVEELVAAGATRVREHEEMGDHWVVMQDPEGNEFCVQ